MVITVKLKVKVQILIKINITITVTVTVTLTVTVTVAVAVAVTVTSCPALICSPNWVKFRKYPPGPMVTPITLLICIPEAEADVVRKVRDFQVTKYDKVSSTRERGTCIPEVRCAPSRNSSVAGRRELKLMTPMLQATAACS